MTDPIRDGLDRLAKEFGKLLEKPNNILSINKTTPIELVQFFGLTQKEAKAWLEKEPNFIPSDDSYHDKKSDKKLPEPFDYFVG